SFLSACFGVGAALVRRAGRVRAERVRTGARRRRRSGRGAAPSGAAAPRGAGGGDPAQPPPPPERAGVQAGTGRPRPRVDRIRAAGDALPPCALKSSLSTRKVGNKPG